MATSLVEQAPVAKANSTQVDLDEYDEEQVRLMEERCILVTPDDVAYGEESKKTCHLMTNINQGLLHRAFSVFLFRPSDGKLLLQKRADEKITFPGMWTNTCCSHPLSTKDEREEKDQLGVRRAAIRKLPHELGIDASQISPSDFVYLTRIHYMAGSGSADAVWGEHEVDYILVATKDVTYDLNPNEVSAARYVSLEELDAMLEDDAYTFTPWFMTLVRSNLLRDWWTALLDRSKSLGEVSASVLASETDDTIRRMS